MGREELKRLVTQKQHYEQSVAALEAEQNRLREALSNSDPEVLQVRLTPCFFLGGGAMSLSYLLCGIIRGFSLWRPCLLAC